MSQVNDSTLTKEIRIASGAATSGYTDIRGAKRIRVRVPSAWDAANITFMAKEAVTDKPGLRLTIAAAKVRDVSGGALLKVANIVTNEAAWYDVPAGVLGLCHIAMRSTNTGSEADVNQTADRDLILALTF